MPTTIGFNFSGGAGGPNDTNIVVGADLYPTTVSGITFGWDVLPDLRPSRNSSGPRFEGMQFRRNTTSIFRVDLLGAWGLRFGAYDTVSFASVNFQILDGSNLMLDRTGTGNSVSNVFLDGDLNQYSTEQDWDSNAVSYSYNFASHVAIVLNPNSSGSVNQIGHLELTQSLTANSLQLKHHRRIRGL